MCTIISNVRTGRQANSTSDLSFLPIVGKILLFKNGLEIESVFLKAFHMLLTERNCYHFSFSPGHHLMHVSCGPEKKEINLSSSFSVRPTEVNIQVLIMGKFPEEDEGIHMKLLPFSFHYCYSYSSPTTSRQAQEKKPKTGDEKALAGSSLKRLYSAF